MYPYVGQKNRKSITSLSFYVFIQTFEHVEEVLRKIELMRRANLTDLVNIDP